MQIAYSFLSTRRVNEAVGSNTLSYVSYGAMSDLVKYGITAGLAVQAVSGQWVVILTTVIGGIIGNTIGHITKAGD